MEDINLKAQDIINKFEDERKKGAKVCRILLGVGIPLIVIGALFLFSISANVKGNAALATALKAVGALLLFVGAIMNILGAVRSANYKKQIVGKISEDVYNLYFKERKMDAKNGFKLEKLMEPGFFSKPDRWDSYNYMSSSWDGIPFEKCDYNLEKKHLSTAGKDIHYEYTTYAKGTMYFFDFEREFGTTVKVLERKGYPYHSGKVFAADVFYDFKKDIWKEYAAKGAMAVEMESFALYINAAYLGKKALTMLTVTDHFLKEGRLTPEQRQTGLKNMIDSAIELAEKYA